MNSVGIALIGAGLIGRQHAACLKEIVDRRLLPVRLVVVCDRLGERAESARKDFGFTHAVDNPVTAIEQDGVDAVYICTPTLQHAEILQLAAERGKAIFCEKPLAHTADEAQKMADVVRQYKVKAQVGLVLRYSPVFMELKALLSGADPSVAGLKPMGMQFRDDQCLPVDGYYKSKWRADIAISGGGTLIEHSIHDIDVLRWFFGEPKSVYANLSYFSKHEGIEDAASVVFSFPSGFTVNLLSVWHQIPPRQSERRIEIFCDRAWISSVGDFEGDIEVQVDERPTVKLDAAQVLERYRSTGNIDKVLPDSVCNAYLQESYQFIHSLLKGETPSPDLNEAVQAHRLVDAIYRSAKIAQPVELLLV